MQIGKSPTAYVCDISGLSQQALIKHLQGSFFSKKLLTIFAKSSILNVRLKLATPLTCTQNSTHLDVVRALSN